MLRDRLLVTATTSSRETSAAVSPPSSTPPPGHGADAASCTGSASVPAGLDTSRSMRTGFGVAFGGGAEVEVETVVGSAACDPLQPAATTARKSRAQLRLTPAILCNS